MCDIKFEVQHGLFASCVIGLLRSAEVVALPGSGIEPRGDGVAASLRESSHACSLGEILPDEAVGVLVGAAFP